MKRSFLEEMGLEKEAIDKIMAANGEDIEKAKGNLDQLKEQLSSVQKDVVQRDADLKDLQDKLTAAQADSGKLSDVQGQLATLQTEYATKTQEWANKQAEWEAETARRAYRSALKEAMGGLKFSSSAASREFERDATEANLQMDGEKLIGFNDFVDKWKGNNADAFASEQPTPPGSPYPLPPKGMGGQTPPNKFGFHFNTIHPMPDNG